MSSQLISLASTIQIQGLNSLIGGFSFASALAWYGLVQAIISKYVKSGPTIQAHLLAAVLTTLIGVFVYMVIKALATNVKLQEPGQGTVFAVTR